MDRHIKDSWLQSGKPEQRASYRAGGLQAASSGMSRRAVDMAETQLSDGVNPQAVELAGAVVASQTAEIQEMDQLLRTLRA